MRLLPTLLLLWALPAWAISPGDGVAVRFKDGSSLTGVLAELTQREVTLDIGGARATWRMDSVKKIELRSNDVQRFLDLEREAGNDPAQLRRLADFARSHGLYTYYDQLTGRCSPACLDAGTAQLNQSYQGQAPPQPRQEAAKAQQRPMGFNTQPPEVQQTAPPGNYDAIQAYAATPAYYRTPGYLSVPIVYVPVPVSPAREITQEERDAFLKEVQARREALRHRVTTPLEIWQFRLQEALDRQAHGLGFSSEQF